MPATLSLSSRHPPLLLLESLSMYPAKSINVRTQAYSSNLKMTSKSITLLLSSTYWDLPWACLSLLITTYWPPSRSLPTSKTELEQTYPLCSISRREAIDCDLSWPRSQRRVPAGLTMTVWKKAWVWPFLALKSPVCLRSLFAVL